MNRVYQGKPAVVCGEICRWQQVLFFLCENSKNQKPGLLGTVGGGYLAMIPEEMKLVDVQTVSREGLADIREVAVKRRKSVQDKM